MRVCIAYTAVYVQTGWIKLLYSVQERSVYMTCTKHFFVYTRYIRSHTQRYVRVVQGVFRYFSLINNHPIKWNLSLVSRFVKIVFFGIRTIYSCVSLLHVKITTHISVRYGTFVSAKRSFLPRYSKFQTLHQPSNAWVYCYCSRKINSEWGTRLICRLICMLQYNRNKYLWKYENVKLCVKSDRRDRLFSESCQLKT